VYRGFDIGTAKPDATARARVPHEGLDVADPGERYNAARWAASAAAWIDVARAAGRRVVVVGGTGLYLRALFAPFFVEPAMDPERRRALAAELDAMPTDALRRWCRSLDPARAGFGRTQLLRAIEVALLTGQRITDLHRSALRPPACAARYLLVDPGPALAGRIEQRVDDMLARGWADEVRALVDRVPPGAPAWNATGYRSIRRLVDGQSRLDAARMEVVIATRQYAKRQRTWFRHQLPPEEVQRLDLSAPDGRSRALDWWNVEDDA
jgi:tRNA dimethylallyltransferase